MSGGNFVGKLKGLIAKMWEEVVSDDDVPKKKKKKKARPSSGGPSNPVVNNERNAAGGGPGVEPASATAARVVDAGSPKAAAAVSAPTGNNGIPASIRPAPTTPPPPPPAQSDPSVPVTGSSGINYGAAESSIPGGVKPDFAKKFAGRDTEAKKLIAGSKSGINKMLEKKPEEAGPKKLAEKLPQRQKENDATKAEKMAKESSLVYLVRGKDRGRDAWHYVLVHRHLLHIFLKHTQGGTVDVAKFGTILFSGWGKDPSPEIVAKIENGEY